VVDALFGIGLQRPIEGLYADWIENLSASSGLRLALDIPSGLDADTGHRPGACFRADHTVTFIALKPGLPHPRRPRPPASSIWPIDVDAKPSPRAGPPLP
jgi:hydroxyethylthiazole kinase-like uncharacterized protein yjeF